MNYKFNVYKVEVREKADSSYSRGNRWKIYSIDIKQEAYSVIWELIEYLFEFAIKTILQLVLRSIGDKFLNDVPVFAVLPHQLNQFLVFLGGPSLMTDVGPQIV